MEITILCENTIGRKNNKTCLAEWGFSSFIEMKGVNILFDTGHTEIYKHNAKALGVDLNKADFLVLSHRHWDHTGGIQFHEFKTKKKLILHPGLLSALPGNEAEKIKNDFEIIASKEPLEFYRNVYFLGQIPRLNDFEKGEYEGDKMFEDSALAIKTGKGVIVITGCSHSGVVNICEYAKKITGQKLYAVVGGFHLFEEDQKAINGAIEYFKKEKPEFLYPMHCVDSPTMAKFHNAFGVKKISSGDAIELDV